MYIPVTYEQDFDDLWMHLKSKYPEKLFNLDGVGEQLDMSKFSKKFFSSAVTSDASIDANANVDDMSVIAYEKELPKPFLKMNSYYILWKELKKLYGRPFADSVVEMQLTGDIYINDMHGIGAGKPYCFNYSTYDILTKGLPMVKKVKCEPPKYLYSFKSQLEQFVTIASNSTLGASGTADMLIMMAYYVKNMLKTLSDAHFTFADEEAVWKYVRENLVSFVYTINQPMRGNQCVTEDTEVLTPGGWKKYDELHVGDDIYTWHDNELRIQQVQRVNVNDYDGEMHRYRGERFDMQVTPNHRVLYATDPLEQDLKLKSSQEVMETEKIYIPVVASDWQGGEESWPQAITSESLDAAITKECVHYQGKVWCPTTEDGVVVFRHNGTAFISGNSPFTNLSVYDDNFLDKLCADYIFPDGSTPDKEIVKKLQNIYLDIMNEELQRTPLTFPVTTACFSIDGDNNIQDEAFLHNIAQKNLQWGFINMYAGSSSTLSSCCFDGSQPVLTRSSAGVSLTTFKELAEASWEDSKRNFTIFHNGSWVKGKLIKLPRRPMYEVTTSNNKKILVTDNHYHCTLRGDVPTTELTTDDYLLFSTQALSDIPSASRGYSFDEGVLLGAYLGDGSKYKRTDSNGTEVNLSLNKEKYDALIDHLNRAMSHLGEQEFTWRLATPYNNVYPVSTSSKLIFDFIGKFVFGNSCDTKELNLACLEESISFREGILYGYYRTDGGNSNRIYTTSKRLATQMETLLTSLGKASVIDVSDRTDEAVVIRNAEYQRNFPLYCVRWYDPRNKRSMQDVYVVRNNSMFFKITSITPYKGTDDTVYCFTCSDEEPYFTLPNGIITHNCRLRSEQQSEYFNSFGSGSSKIGSLGVCTINFPRLAIQYPLEDDFMEKLEELVGVCAKVNNAKRHIVQKRINNGNEPLYKYEFMELSKQYSTCGVNGFYETIQLLGYDILTEEGQALALRILDKINDTNKIYQNKYKMPHNVEQVPGENLSIKLAEKDKLMGYQNEYNLYSNQFIPLIANADLFDRIKLQGLFDSHFSGGSICHLNVETQITDVKDMEDLIRVAAKKGVVYFAINYVLSQCANGHMSVTNGDKCLVCGEPITDKYTRVVGFLTNIKNWHKVRREEDFPNRQFYQGEEIAPPEEEIEKVDLAREAKE